MTLPLDSSKLPSQEHLIAIENAHSAPCEACAATPASNERDEKQRADMVALLRDPRFTMAGGSQFALEIIAAISPVQSETKDVQEDAPRDTAGVASGSTDQPKGGA